MFFELTGVFSITIMLIIYFKHVASLLGLIDRPNERSVHSKGTPRGAGIAFVFSALLLFLLNHFSLLMHYKWTIVAILFVFTIGILDDHKDASPKTKFFIIIVSTVLLSFDDILINDVGTFFGIHIILGWLALPFTVFAVTGFTNAMNLVDGLDGLAGTLGVIILGAFAVVGYQHHDPFILWLSLFFIVALLAFLIFNWHPASVFMGDSGSLTLGFVISVVAIKSLSYIPTVSVLFIAALPILDTLVVMIRRKRNGKSVFTPDRLHMHHILWHFFSENTPLTVVVLGTIQLIYSLVGLSLKREMDEGILLLLFLLNVLLIYLLLNTVIRKQQKEG